MPEREALTMVADLMCLAARTAPKTRGVDVVKTMILAGPDKDAVADEMERIARETEQPFFLRDAENLRLSPMAVLVAAANRRAGLKTCGFCGYENCAANEKAGATCAFNHMDLGIAASSAASVAALHHADCRIMYTVGRAVCNLKLFDDGVIAAVGIPLSATGKSPYFDRKMPDLKKS
ncbi:MAG: ferredoxin [Planctomycetes bacterium]|nr:ferredoxin [Planctomycetota bacterium]